jgi:2-methylcitrate dehydratase PrpD
MATYELVENCLNTKFDDIPPDVVEHAKLSLLNWASVAVGGSRHQAVEILLRIARDLDVSQQV